MATAPVRKIFTAFYCPEVRKMPEWLFNKREEKEGNEKKTQDPLPVVASFSHIDISNQLGINNIFFLIGSLPQINTIELEFKKILMKEQELFNGRESKEKGEEEEERVSRGKDVFVSDFCQILMII